MIDEKIIRRLITLNALKDQHIKTLAAKLELEEVPAGKYLFKLGDQDNKSLYLIEGELVLANEKGPVQLLKAGTKESKHPVAHHQPRPLSAVSKTLVKILRIDSQMIDTMITWDQSSNQVNDDEQDDDDWMTKMLETKALHKIPPANIQAMFLRMEEVHKRKGEHVVTQGDEGDYYYIIKSGSCAVVRKTRTHPDGVKLAELDVGDAFGEEALISETNRNASVIMTTDGSLMRLSKEDFIKLLNEPLITSEDYESGSKLVAEEGAIWLDARLPNEFQNGHIPGSINLPFYLLRNKADELDADKTYVVYCDSGSRSSAVAFLLNERGFDARLLKGGLVKAPPEVLKKSA